MPRLALEGRRDNGSQQPGEFLGRCLAKGNRRKGSDQ